MSNQKVTLQLDSEKVPVLSPLARIVIVGVGAGVTLVIVLAYPVYTLTSDWFVPQVSLGGLRHSGAVAVWGILGLLVAAAVGPITARWVGADTRSRRVAVGGMAGSMAGAVLYVGLGAAAAGVVANMPLYKFVIGSGYSDIEWFLTWAIAVNANFQLVGGVAWLFLGVSATLGIVGALLTPPRETTRRLPGDPRTDAIQWIILLTLTVLGMLPAMTLTTAVTSVWLIVPNILVSYGVIQHWPAELMQEVFLFQPWLIMTIAQILGLRWLLGSSQPRLLPRWLVKAACSAIGYSSVGLVGLMFLALVGGQPLNLLACVISLSLGIEFLIVGSRLRQREAGEACTQLVYPGHWPLIQAVHLGLALVLFISHISAIASALNVVLLPITFLGPLLDTVGPPLGVEWILSTLLSLASVHLGVAILLVVIAVLGSIIQSLVRGRANVLGTQRWVLAGRGSLLKLSRSVKWLAIGVLILSVFILRMYIFLSIAVFLGGLKLFSARVSLRRVPWWAIALSFVLCLANFLLLLYSVVDFSVWWHALGFALIVIPPATFAYKAVDAYSGWSALAVRQVISIGLALLAVLLMYSRQWTMDVVGGISRYDGHIWQNYTPDNSILGSLLYQMFRDGQGNLWFGGDSGLLIWYNGEWGGTIVEPLSSELLQGRRGRIPHFLEDSTGRLWVGIGSSLSERSYGDETFEELEFPDQSINALLESSDGTLWIGTSHGVIRLKSPTSN